MLCLNTVTTAPLLKIRQKLKTLTWFKNKALTKRKANPGTLDQSALGDKAAQSVRLSFRSFLKPYFKPDIPFPIIGFYPCLCLCAFSENQNLSLELPAMTGTIPFYQEETFLEGEEEDRQREGWNT